MPWTLILAASLHPTPWRNGHGISHEIAAHPGHWTVSLATLERDAPFSHYPHADRIFTPIAGDPPPEIAFDGGPFEPCPLLRPRHFPGETPVLSRIPAPGRAFNVIVDRRHCRAEVTLATPGTSISPAARLAFLHCLTGQAGPATSGDTLRHDGTPTPISITGTALLAQLWPL